MTEHYTVDLFRPGTAASAIVNQALSFRQPKLTPPQAFRRLDVIMSLSTNKLILIAPCAILSSRKNNGGKHGNDKAENVGNNG